MPILVNKTYLSIYYILELSCVKKLHLLSTSCTHWFLIFNILMHHQKDVQAFKYRSINNRYTKQMHHTSYSEAIHTLPAYLDYIVWIWYVLCMGIRFRQRQEKQKSSYILHFSRSSFENVLYYTRIYHISKDHCN